MTISETHSAAEAADIQSDDPVSLHPDNVSEGGDHRDAVPAEQIWDLQDLSNQSASDILLFNE